MEILTPIITALLGFAGGLLTPWVKHKIEHSKSLSVSRRAEIKVWRTAIARANLRDESELQDFCSSVVYSKLRVHMDQALIEKVEAPRTSYVGGGRGDEVRKYMLLDEVARLEKKWNLL